MNSITRKSKGNNIASTRKINSIKIPFKQPVDIPKFNKENINIGLLIVTAHGSIPIDNELNLPIADLPVVRDVRDLRDTIQYYNTNYIINLLHYQVIIIFLNQNKEKLKVQKKMIMQAIRLFLK